MPNRILREGILTSPRIARLGWAEEVFYRRLHSVVDDFGRYYADPGMLRAACYPRQLSKVSDSDIGKWLTVLVEAALVRVYPASDGERYLEVLDFGQQVRAKKSKFPDMLSDCVADAQQPQANARLDVSESVSEGVDDSARSRSSQPSIEGIPDALLADYLIVRKAKKAGALTDTALAGLKREAEKAGVTLETAIRVCCERGWQGFKADWYMGDKPVAQVTVPGSTAKDPALAKLDADAKATKPMSAEQRVALAELTQRFKVAA